MVIERRAYPTSNGMKFKADEELGLRKDKWLPMVLELACALGVSSEFPNAHKLFQKFTNIELTEKTVANQVEKTGNKLQLGSFKKETFIRGKKGRQRKKRQPNHTRCNICRSRWRNDSA